MDANVTNQLTGSEAEDQKIELKARELGFGELKDSPDLLEKLYPQIRELQDEVERSRMKRIRLEDQMLALSPAQRRNDLLDFVRRGKFAVGNVYILPEIINICPKLLDSGLIDFSAPDYDHQRTLQHLLADFSKVEKEVFGEDLAIRSLLEKYGVRITTPQYLTRAWLEKALGAELADLLHKLNRPIHQSSPFFHKPEAYRDDQIRKFKTHTAGYLSGDLERLIDAYSEDQLLLEQFESPKNSETPIKQFIYQNLPDYLENYPREQDYTGPRVEAPPSLARQKIHPGVHFLGRDQSPEFQGGIMVDGNFGYDEKGQLITFSDRLIIDHHDKLDQTRYDTATIMAGRFWAGKSGRQVHMLDKSRQLQTYFSEAETPDGHKIKRLNTMINHLDSDSILSLWVLRNPVRAQNYKTIIDNISSCGDFLVGSQVMDYGATARDYEYIIRNYLRACEDDIRAGRTLEMGKNMKREKERLEKMRQEKDQLEKTFLEKQAGHAALQTLDGEVTVIKNNGSLPPKEKGKLLGQKQRERDSLIKSQFAEDARSLEKADRELKTQQQKITKAEKDIQEGRKAKLANAENAKIISHMLDTIEDVIRQPFKYGKFLQQERKNEQDTIQEIDELYRNGNIELDINSQDPDMVVMSPLKDKKLPDLKSIDGLYFFLRKREDLNKELVVTMDNKFYMAAINTQDKRTLSKYDFNALIDQARALEGRFINEKISALSATLAAETDPAKQGKLEKELATCQADLAKNTRGALWRNRTQMIFCFKSYLPPEDFLHLVSAWKKDQLTVSQHKRPSSNPPAKKQPSGKKKKSSNPPPSAPEKKELDDQGKFDLIVSRLLDKEAGHPERRLVMEKLFRQDIREILSANPDFFRQMTRVLDSLNGEPEIQDMLVTSLVCPQKGKYHCEGPLMIHHLQLMLANARKIRDGQNVYGVADPVFQFMSAQLKKTGATDSENGLPLEILQYVFFHDLKKPDSLTAQSLDAAGNEVAKEISWQDWLDMLAAQGKEKSPSFQTASDSPAFPVREISYYHFSAGEDTNHGKRSAKAIEKLTNVPDIIKKAIAQHEIGFQFDNVKAQSFQQHLGAFTPAEQNLILTGSFLDTVSSLRENGQPNLDAFEKMIVARDNLFLIEKFLGWCRDNHRKTERKAMDALYRTDEKIGKQRLVQALEKSYDLEKLTGKIKSSGVFTPDDLIVITGEINHDFSAMARKLGGTKMGKLREFLKYCVMEYQLPDF